MHPNDSLDKIAYELELIRKHIDKNGIINITISGETKEGMSSLAFRNNYIHKK